MTPADDCCVLIRMTYAFSRDGAMPFSSIWHKVNKQEVPINAVWLSAFISLCMALPVTELNLPTCSNLFRNEVAVHSYIYSI